MPGRSSKVLFCVLRRFNQITLMTLFQAFVSRKRMQVVFFLRDQLRGNQMEMIMGGGFGECGLNLEISFAVYFLC